MESVHDYKSLSPPLHHRKLKRLKKSSIHASNEEPSAESAKEVVSSSPPVESSESQDLVPQRISEVFGGEDELISKESLIHSSKESSSSESLNEVVSLPPVESLGSRDLASQWISDAFGGDNELDSDFDGLRLGEDGKKTKRILDFEVMEDGFQEKRTDQSGEAEETVADWKKERIGKKLVNEEDSNESEGCDVGNDLNSGFHWLNGADRKGTKRVLDFDDVGFEGPKSDQSSGVGEIIVDLKAGRPEKKRVNEEDSSENKGKKKKKSVKRDGDDVKPKTSRRREEKERQIYVQQLHAESQRLLRETRDATFKPLPVVQKPISSVLEKIRQRKLEVLKKTISLQNKFCVTENDGNLREDLMDHDSEIIFAKEREVDISVEVVQEKTTVCHADVESGLDVSPLDGSQEATRQSNNENTPSQMAVDEQSMHAFRAPVDDTQDLFGDSQSSEGKDHIHNDQNNSPTEEVFAPSFLAMKLKFDSAPPDDTSDDEEYNDKENIDPDRTDNGCSSPRGDPVKAFVDDEAVEEDDSDNDLMRFPENEEDDDIEDLKDLIATGYDEEPIDNEMRNQLHQKWLEQQDAAGTDNLMQRLKFGAKLKDTTFLEEDDEEETDGNDDEFGNAEENLAKTSLVRMNSRKAKQMMPHLFSDMNDGYLSDGEETDRKLTKQRLLEKTEEQVTLLSPAKDESCREMFGLIKKLNIVPDAKTKPKTSSFFDKMLTGRNINASSKSSFLGRATSHSLPSHKKGTSAVRAFIFGRDDSNSRNSVSMSEDSSDMIPSENPPARTTTTKFSSSQSKVSTQSKKAAPAAEAASGASLFEILKLSSLQSNVCNQDATVGLTQTVYASFKIPKRPVKIEGRI